MHARLALGLFALALPMSGAAPAQPNAAAPSRLPGLRSRWTA